MQQENKKMYNLTRNSAIQYKPGDLVAIKRTQLGTSIKLHRKYLRPYEVLKVKPNERYDRTPLRTHAYFHIC